jgi:hypothetical protein
MKIPGCSATIYAHAKGEVLLHLGTDYQFYREYFGYQSGRPRYGQAAHQAFDCMTLAFETRDRTVLSTGVPKDPIANSWIKNLLHISDSYCPGGFMDGLEWHTRLAVIKTGRCSDEELVVPLRYLFDSLRRRLVLVRLTSRHALSELDVFQALRTGFVSGHHPDQVAGFTIWPLDHPAQVEYAMNDVEPVGSDTILNVAQAMLTGATIDPYPVIAPSRQQRLPLSP